MQALLDLIPTNPTDAERAGYTWADGQDLHMLKRLGTVGLAEVALGMGVDAGWSNGVVANVVVRALVDKRDGGTAERSKQVAKMDAERARRALLSRLAGTLLAVADQKHDADVAAWESPHTNRIDYYDPQEMEASAAADRESSEIFTARMFDLER